MASNGHHHNYVKKFVWFPTPSRGSVLKIAFISFLEHGSGGQELPLDASCDELCPSYNVIFFYIMYLKTVWNAYPFVEQSWVHTSVYHPLNCDKNFKNIWQVSFKNDLDDNIGWICFCFLHDFLFVLKPEAKCNHQERDNAHEHCPYANACKDVCHCAELGVDLRVHCVVITSLVTKFTFGIFFLVTKMSKMRAPAIEIFPNV